jgi:hypothetical protein
MVKWAQVAVIFIDFPLAQITVDAASGCIMNRCGSRSPHRFDNVVRQQRSFNRKSISGSVTRTSDVGIRGEMNDKVVRTRCVRQRVDVFHINANDSQS